MRTTDYGILLLTVFLTACAGNPAVRLAAIKPPVVQTVPPVTGSAATLSGLTVVEHAREMLGIPYLYGGDSPQGFDCSGLVSYAYQQAGIEVPRTSSDQYRYAQKVPLHSLLPGDLLFFRLQPPKVSHVAIYDRDGRFIHAPSSGKEVSYASLDNPYWREHLLGAGRF
ncbi:MAG TPA: C40 family peptidase [Malonomonas sp.]